MKLVIAIIILAHTAAYCWRSKTSGGEVESAKSQYIEERMKRYRQKQEFAETVGEQSWILQDEQ